MVKTFPKSRVCVLDAYPMFLDGLKKAISFSKINHVSLASTDGRRALFVYCLDSIQKQYDSTQCTYPKVIGLDTTSIEKKYKAFLDKYFDLLMSKMPIPYCGKISFSSPDLEFQAEKCLRSVKSKKGLIKFEKSLKVKRLLDVS